MTGKTAEESRGGTFLGKARAGRRPAGPGIATSKMRARNQWL